VSEFLQRVAAEIQARRLLLPRQKILVAVSGGVDSMVLLHALNSLAKENRWQIFVAHFNHQLRGRASDADEKLVRRTAKKLGLEFSGGGADVQRFAEQSKFSTEMAARKLRHEFLAQAAKKQKLSTIALAHHADDQVELFFLRLFRGAGGAGLAGMKWRSPSPADGTISLVRPLLDCTKVELLEFARQGKVLYRDDATNLSDDMLRNRVRNELLPLLQKKYQPGLAKTVLRVMEITGAETEFVSAAVRVWREKAGKQDLSAAPVALQRKVLQQALSAAGLVPDFELVEQLRQAADTFVSVSPSLSVARNQAGQLQLREQLEGGFNMEERKLKLQGRTGQAEFGGQKFSWHLKKFSGLRQRGMLPTECFDAEQIGAEIVLRHWRAGDRFQPIGLPKAAKLQDLFVNAKIPAAQRRKLVLATTATGEIFWVPGLRIGEKFKLTSQTRRQLVWKLS